MNRKIESTLVWLGPALLVMGFCTHRLWRQFPSGRFAELVVIALFAIALGELLGKLLGRWLPRSRAIAMVLPWCLLLTVFAGPLPVLATSLLFLATAALGARAFPQSPILLQTLLGALVVSGLVGWLLPLPIHYGWVYLLLCVGAIAVCRHHLLAGLRESARAWNQAVSTSPRMATFAVTFVGLATTAAWLPTLQFDDLTYHLRLPWQLQEQGFYLAAPQFQVWALAPWSSDILHALPQLIGGQEARGPVNVAWLVILAGGLWQLSANLGAIPTSRWLAIALAASLPLTAALAAGMQTEPLTAAALVWMAALVSGSRDGGLRFWLALAVLAGGLVALKLVAAAMAGVLLVWALIRHPWPSPLRILAVAGVGLAVAGSSYAYAWLLAGNPVLPLFNAWFQSPYFPAVSFSDDRWHAGFGPRLLWDITFETDRYMEAHKGAAGFMLVALCGVWLLALLKRRTRIAAIVATVTLLLPLIPLQYLRYAYPGLVLLCAVLVAAGPSLGKPSRFGWLAVALCILNLGFQANGNWMLRNGAIKSTVQTAGRDTPIMVRFAPERVLAAAIRDSGEQEGTVLLLDPATPFFAEFGSRGRTVSWHSPSLQEAAERAEQAPSGRLWSELMRRQDVRHVILATASVTPAQKQALRTLGAVHRKTVAGAEWWTIPGEKPTMQPTVQQATP